MCVYVYIYIYIYIHTHDYHSLHDIGGDDGEEAHLVVPLEDLGWHYAQSAY